MVKITYHDKGRIAYKEAWDLQKRLFETLLKNKSEGVKNDAPGLNQLLFCEHNPVYTLGKHGDVKNLLFSESQINAMGAEFYPIDRGGDITYHGPGQITGYPVWDLDVLGIGIKAYIEGMEEAIIELIGRYGITGSRIAGASGVWLDAGKPGLERKISAIGVRASKSVTMHGFALNVNTELSWFTRIVPCGITDKGVTSMQKELGHMLDFEKVKLELLSIFSKTFNFAL